MKTMDFRRVRYLFTDVDDTLTTNGRLLPETYSALWALARAGIEIIPVTGGCAGWCDQIIRTWPVTAVIGEGGAFYIAKDREQRTEWRFWTTYAEHRADQAAIRQTIEAMASDFPITFAKDQAFRKADVAVDYNQDHRLTPDQVTVLCNRLLAKGFNVKKSSIHINVWRGEFDKCAMARRLAGELLGLSEPELKASAVFIGDAPNDESMFAFFPNSVGVANIVPHLPNMTHKPAVLTTERCGLGFVEMADHWLSHISASASATPNPATGFK